MAKEGGYSFRRKVVGKPLLSRLLCRRIHTTKELVNETAQGRVCTAEETKCMERWGLAHGRRGQVGPL